MSSTTLLKPSDGSMKAWIIVMPSLIVPMMMMLSISSAEAFQSSSSEGETKIQSGMGAVSLLIGSDNLITSPLALGTMLISLILSIVLLCLR